MGLDKKYEAVLRLGAVSDTQDKTGKITETSNIKHQTSKKHQITNTKIQEVLKSFIGKQKQIPPMYSAKKISGKKLYELARQGQTIKRQPQDVEIYDIKLKSHHLTSSHPHITISCHVSSGTYIRTLAHDIGQKLGTGAYLEELKRTAIGDFRLEDAIFIRHPDRAQQGEWRDLVADASDSEISRLREYTPLEMTRGRRVRLGRNDNTDARAITPANWRQRLIPLKTVLVSGTFDGIHEGHKNYFQQARQYGQRLIGVVGRDKIVEQIKGRLPRYSEKERIAFAKQCPEIDRVYLGIIGSRDKIYDFTASLKPDIIALGYDQQAYTENLEKEMKKRGLAVKVIRLKPFYPEKYKNSFINRPALTKTVKTANL